MAQVEHAGALLVGLAVIALLQSVCLGLGWQPLITLPLMLAGGIWALREGITRYLRRCQRQVEQRLAFWIHDRQAREDEATFIRATATVAQALRNAMVFLGVWSGLLVMSQWAPPWEILSAVWGALLMARFIQVRMDRALRRLWVEKANGRLNQDVPAPMPSARTRAQLNALDPRLELGTLIRSRAWSENDRQCLQHYLLARWRDASSWEETGALMPLLDQESAFDALEHLVDTGQWGRLQAILPRMPKAWARESGPNRFSPLAQCFVRINRPLPASCIEGMWHFMGPAAWKDGPENRCILLLSGLRGALKNKDADAYLRWKAAFASPEEVRRVLHYHLYFGDNPYGLFAAAQLRELLATPYQCFAALIMAHRLDRSDLQAMAQDQLAALTPDERAALQTDPEAAWAQQDAATVDAWVATLPAEERLAWRTDHPTVPWPLTLAQDRQTYLENRPAPVATRSRPRA